MDKSTISTKPIYILKLNKPTYYPLNRISLKHFPFPSDFLSQNTQPSHSPKHFPSIFLTNQTKVITKKKKKKNIYIYIYIPYLSLSLSLSLSLALHYVYTCFSLWSFPIQSLISDSQSKHNTALAVESFINNWLSWVDFGICYAQWLCSVVVVVVVDKGWCECSNLGYLLRSLAIVPTPFRFVSLSTLLLHLIFLFVCGFVFILCFCLWVWNVNYVFDEMLSKR